MVLIALAGACFAAALLLVVTAATYQALVLAAGGAALALERRPSRNIAPDAARGHLSGMASASV